MKKPCFLAAAMAAAILLTAACGAPGAETPNEKAEPSGSVQVLPTPETGGVTMLCTIVDGAEEGTLLLALQGEDASAVYRISAKNLPITVDGDAAEWSDLTDGMSVEVTYSGDVLETFPAQLADVTALAAKTPDGGSFTDLCGLYLKVLDDLWETDSGLNDGINLAGVDLSTAPGELSAAEKTAVIWRFGEKHGVETVAGTYQELAERGYIDAEQLQWEDGCLFSITENNSHDTACYVLPVLNFDAEKWRSGTGAYFFMDCTCVWPEGGSWTDYTVGAEAIS